MKSRVLNLIAFLTIVGNLVAQSADPVLMTINGKPILKSEFEYIYNKNNTNNSLDKKSLKEYVDLFVNFKLKVAEAMAKGVDTTASFRNELSGYRSQLTKPYLTDSKVDEALLQEAYNRSKEDIDVSHVLIRVSPNATPADTLKAWKEINAIYKRLQKEDFGKVAKEVSQDQSAEFNNGHIGWISAFRTVYPFETVAYNTPVGGISKPVRTQFGYHILKVHGRRNTPGEVMVSHIMVFTKKGDELANKKAKATIDSLYARVKAGDDFAELAKKYSDDKSSAVKGGELPWFGTGRMVPEFENAAFALKSNGDVSTPVESAYGWHIIKLLDRKGLASFDELRADLERKIKHDERAAKGQQVFIAKLKSEYSYKENAVAIDEFVKMLDGHSLSDSLFNASINNLSLPLISFGQQSISQSEFAKYLKKNDYTDKTVAADIIREKLDEFASAELLKYEDTQLERKYTDFRNLIQEYHDGILLFEISNREVWEKASKDTEGLSKFFASHKSDYKWEKPHFKGRIISCKDEESMKMAKALLRKLPADSIDKGLHLRLNDSIQHVRIEKGIFVQGDNKAVDKYEFKVKDNYETPKDFPFVFTYGKMLKKSPEDYTDVRGLVTADYQEYLESEWVKNLRAKYPVQINQDVLKTVKQN